MLSKGVRRSAVCFSIAAWVFGTLPPPLLSQPSSVTGTMAGRVFDKDAKTPVSGVTVRAQRVTTDERFIGRETDALGSYLLSDVPSGVYAFTLDYDGATYPVEGSFDVRSPMSFLLESCFVLDRVSKTASLRADCSSGLYAETQVVSLGPHRFFRAQPSSPDDALAQQADEQLTITHSGLECIVNDYFPQLGAGVAPTDQVQVARVYFRAAQFPDYYYVDMQPTENGYTAILPKPSPETTEIIYYLEGIHQNYNPTQTELFSPEVTDHVTCERRSPGTAYFTGDNPGIIVGATVAGATSVPPGFLASGISSFVSASGTVATVAATAAAGGATGGLGTTGLVLIIAGTAGAAAVIAAEAIGESEASPIR